MNRQAVVMGITSSPSSWIAALFLQNQGFRVVPVHIEINCPGYFTTQAITPAQTFLSKLGLTIKTLDCSEDFFEKIVQRCMADRLSGTHSSSLLRWNEFIIETLIAQADALDIYHIATGHQVQKEGSSLYRTRILEEGLCDSLFWSRIPRSITSRALFPTTGITADHFRKLFAEIGSDAMIFDEFQKEKSNPGRSPAEFFAADFWSTSAGKQGVPGDLIRPGTVKSLSGFSTFTHAGIFFHGIGERFSADENYFVHDVLPLENKLVVAHPSECLSQQWLLKDLFINREDIINPQALALDFIGGYRLRHFSGHLFIFNGAMGMAISSSGGIFGVAKNQWLGLYDRNELVGSARIHEILTA